MKHLAVVMAMALWMTASGCGQQASTAVKFTNTDVTGADFGKGFALTDHTGKPRTLMDFKGKIVVMFFGFTQCPDVCPTALTRAQEIKQQLGKDGERLQVIFVSVDPERDSAELLGNYLSAFDSEFVGLRGTPEQTRAAAKAFNVFYEKVPTGSSYSINHTAITYILDQQSRLRLGMRHSQEADDYVADLRALMKQAP